MQTPTTMRTGAGAGGMGAGAGMGNILGMGMGMGAMGMSGIGMGGIGMGGLGSIGGGLGMGSVTSMGAVRGLQPYQNTYAARIKEGATALLLPPAGIVASGKRKRATVATNAKAVEAAASFDFGDSDFGGSDAGASDAELDKDDPNDVDAEAADARLRTLQRQQRIAVPPAHLLASVTNPTTTAAATTATSSSHQQQQQQQKPPRRLRRTRHDYLLPFYRDSAALIAEALVPIRLDLDIDGMKLKDCFVWNLKEKFLTPKKFAEMTCEDLDIPHSIYGASIEEAMKSQIADHLNLLSAEVPFEDDSRIIINLDILFNQYHLIDRFEWDLSSPLTPEDFALQLSKDLGLGSEFPPLVSHAIHEQIAKVKTVVAAVGAAGPNISPIEDVDEANLILGMLRETTTKPLEVGLRTYAREHEVEEWGPIVEEMSREAIDKYVAEREKEKIRKQRNNRRRTAGFMDVGGAASFMTPGNLALDEESWANPEERAVWKCSHCLVCIEFVSVASIVCGKCRVQS
ncbi:Chromatin structure remodeling complex protein sfh1 [Physocladia obscura]|uniref:Chromatin structure remodeling complex protein sfh1 n=1 Tax=Physocladia obscura TaxID=109957 RepID=A0AAD5STD0_9FUNG|nr:Chromatin structure remodeling complex protein sfh1 [Physocladia obscura]